MKSALDSLVERLERGTWTPSAPDLVRGSPPIELRTAVPEPFPSSLPFAEPMSLSGYRPENWREILAQAGYRVEARRASCPFCPVEKSGLAVAISEWGVICFRNRAHSRPWHKLGRPEAALPVPFATGSRKHAAHDKDRERGIAIAAREAAAFEWTFAEPADALHPYLHRKAIPPMGLKKDKDGNLILPIYRISDWGIELLTSLERISAAGEKRFEARCRTKAGYCFLDAENIGRIPFPKPERVWIAEGFATAATVAMATQDAACCVFSAGNITPALAAIARHMPKTEFRIAADNDRGTDGNPGLRAALDATIRLGWCSVWPQFPEENEGSDWNDLALSCGIDAVRRQLTVRVS